MMLENQPQMKQPNCTSKQPSPPTTTNSATCKHLLSNSNPKNAPTTPSPQSSISSDSSSYQIRKKTRELPNLSECHGCGVRINHTNPKDRLQILGSVWRVVLLCKKCIKRVEFAEICAYCFDTTLGSECLKCRDCKRYIHKVCVVKYGQFAPWSYCHSDLRFSVCVDCWVPNSIPNSIRVYSRRNRSKNKKVDDSRVLVNNNEPKLLEDAVKDANLAVEKKIDIGEKAKEDALKKAVEVKNALEFANDALGLVAKNDEKGRKSECLDDEELAFRLHRAMNSSPRIATSFCSLNSGSRNVRKRSLGVFERIEVCASKGLNEQHNRSVSEHSDHASFVHLSNLNAGTMVDINSASVKGKEWQDYGQIRMAEVVIKCTSNVENRLQPVLKTFQRRHKQSQELLSEENRTQGLLRLCQSSNILVYRRRNRKCDRNLLTYRKRCTSSNRVPNLRNQISSS